MKKLLLFLILLISAYSQDSNSVSDLQYYPLQTGNYFEYITINSEFPYYSTTTANSISILDDTTLENGFTYKILLNKDIPAKNSTGYYEFQRIDSSDGSVYIYQDDSSLENNERKIDSLYAQTGDNIVCSRTGNLSWDSYLTICAGMRIDTVLGVETHIKEFNDDSGIPSLNYELAAGFGLISSSLCEFSCGSSRLVYAEINGEKYGEHVSLGDLTEYKEQLKYYPLNTGNYFEYLTITANDINDFDTTAHSTTVLGDSTLENGLIYKILLNKNILGNSADYYSFERIDSIDGSVYRYMNDEELENNEYKIDSLFVQAGDTIYSSRIFTGSTEGVYTICTGVYTDTLLGLETEVKTFESPALIDIEYKLARNFGLFYSGVCEISCTNTRLMYAKINGISYGNPITDVEETDYGIPQNFNLSQNYPNPFNPVTNITFDIPNSSLVELTVYDIKGASVKTLTKNEYSPGKYQIKFDGSNLSSGVYFYRLKTSSFAETKKMLLLK